jgi:hypothetical protein
MIIVTLTTTPPNFSQVHESINSLINQTVPPDRIILNVPRDYTRDHFNSSLFELQIQEKRSAKRSRVEINRCHDYGSGTKLIGLLDKKNEIEDDDIIIVVDDDISYPPELVETHKMYHEHYPPGTVFTVEAANISGDLITNSNQVDGSQFHILSGWGSYSLTGRMLTEDMRSIVHYPKSMRLSDDIFFSNLLSHNNTCVIQTPEVNHNTLKVLDHGNSPSQMHNRKELDGGSHNWGNEYKYCKALAFLIEKNLLKIPLDTLVKKKILCRDLYYDFRDAMSESEPTFVNRCMDILELHSILDTIEALGVERQKMLKLQNMYQNITGKQIPPGEFFSHMVSSQKIKYPEFAQQIYREAPLLRHQPETNKVVMVWPHAVKMSGHGCQTRLFQMVDFLVDAGFEIAIFSRSDINSMQWEQADIDYLNSFGITDINIFSPTDSENAGHQFSSYCTKEILKRSYDFCVIHYSNTLTIKHLKKLPKDKLILELHDNLSVNGGLQNIDHSCIDLSTCRTHHVSKTNFDALKLFDVVVNISPIEHSECINIINSAYVPNASHIDSEENTYSQNGVFVASDNSFNANAIKILTSGATFPIDIVGRACNDWGMRFATPNPLVNKIGFVESLSELYKHAAFSVSPIILGTGAKVKIGESLSCGVPVVAMIDSGLSSHIIDGVNGYLCHSFKEFFECCKRLHQDRDLCKQMGDAARAMSKEESRCRSQYDYVFNTYYSRF